MKYSVKTFAELINEGMQVHPSYVAEQEHAMQFPDFKNLDQLESKIKQIESTTQEKSDAE